MYWDLELGKSGDGIRGRVLVGVVVSDVLTPLGPRLGFRRGFALLPRAWEVGKRFGRPIQVGIVVPDIGTPFSPSLGFGGGITLLPRTREVRKRVRRSILAGVVVPNAGTPFSPGLGLTLGPGSGVVIADDFSPLGPSQRFGGRIALLPGAREVRKGIRRFILVSVVVTNVGTPLGPGFGFTLETREPRDGIWRVVLVGVVVSEVSTPLSPSYRRRVSLDGMRWGSRSEKLTFWLRSRRAGDGNGQSVDGKSTNDEGSESDFGEHGDRVS